MSGIETVGVYLTEDERRLLTSLASELEIREESALRCSEGSEAKTYAATSAALRKLMYLPAAQAVDSARARAVVYEAIAVRLCTTSLASMNAYQLGGISRDIADHVVTLLAGATPVCSTCNDTHAMPLNGTEVMCTRCPVPCETCRQQTPQGPYCAVTPCACRCHVATLLTGVTP